MHSQKLDFVGGFIVSSGCIIVADPSFDFGVGCIYTIENVHAGFWDAFIEHSPQGENEIQINRFIIKSRNYKNSKYLQLLREQLSISVDSGYVGYFDSNHFQAGNKQHCKAWYDYCKRSVRPPLYASIITCGVVIFDGCGNGEYICNYYRDENHIVHTIEMIIR